MSLVTWLTGLKFPNKPGNDPWSRIMPPKAHNSDARTEIGRELARKLYDYKLKDLISLSPARKADLQAGVPKAQGV